MLIPQRAQRESRKRQGGRIVDFAELRRQLASPSKLSDGNRQCLLELANRLARAQALGDEYARVEFSHHVTETVSRQVVMV